jgi:DtxR family Mn-dependent transcriptional regulator
MKDRKTHKLSAAQERYVECISDAETHHGHAHISLLADELGVAKPSVVQMVDRLSDRGIVRRQAKAIILTAAGKQIAKDLNGKHALLEEFMVGQLGMDVKTANQEACRMEHLVSSVFLRRLRAFVNRNEKHGK